MSTSKSKFMAPGEAGVLERAGIAAPPPTPRKGSRFRRLVVLLGPPLIVACVFLGIWNLLSYVILNPTQRFLLPPPLQVVKVGFLNWPHLKEILVTGLLPTTQVALTGLAIAIVIGMVSAILMSQARWVERSLYPYAVVVQTIPIIALVPLIGFLLNYSFKSRVLACVMISIFPIITNTLFGLKSADSTLHDLFTLHGAGRLTRLWKLQLPAAMPAIFTGFRISAGLSVIGAIVGDFFFRRGDPGLGVLITNYQSRLQGEQMYGALILAILLGVVTFWVFGLIGRKVVGTWADAAV